MEPRDEPGHDGGKMTDAAAPRLEDCINQTCPWSGLPVSAEALTVYRGHVVGFCHPG